MKKDEGFLKEIERSARGLRRWKDERRTFWNYASVIGAGGWLFVIPVVAGAYLGKYLDRTIAAGGHISWTLTLIILGIAAGIYNVWFFLMRRTK